MKPCWKSAGLTKEGARAAEAIIDRMTGIVQNVSKEVAKAVLAEALFRVYELPLRTERFQEQYKETNGTKG